MISTGCPSNLVVHASEAVLSRWRARYIEKLWGSAIYLHIGLLLLGWCIGLHPKLIAECMAAVAAIFSCLY